MLLVDTRERNPFDFSRLEGWFAGIERKALKLGDYSIAGLENVCVVERKDLPDLVYSFTVERSVFVNRLKQMSRYPHRLLVITAALSQVKSGYSHSMANPNRIFQSLIALLAGINVPFLCTETHELGRKPWPPTCTRSISITGWKATTTADSWPTETFNCALKQGSYSHRVSDSGRNGIIAQDKSSRRDAAKLLQSVPQTQVCSYSFLLIRAIDPSVHGDLEWEPTSLRNGCRYPLDRLLRWSQHDQGYTDDNKHSHAR